MVSVGQNGGLLAVSVFVSLGIYRCSLYWPHWGLPGASVYSNVKRLPGVSVLASLEVKWWLLAYHFGVCQVSFILSNSVSA